MPDGSRTEPRIEAVSRDGFDEAVDVLSEAFFDYPVMRVVIGEAGADYARRLRKLVAFFTEARFTRQDLVLAVVEDSQMTAVANINLPRQAPLDFAGGVDPLEKHRSRVWSDLGPDARARYEVYGEATARCVFLEPHYHLGMIGARRSWQKRSATKRTMIPSSIVRRTIRISGMHPAASCVRNGAMARGMRNLIQ